MSPYGEEVSPMNRMMQPRLSSQPENPADEEITEANSPGLREGKNISI